MFTGNETWVLKFNWKFDEFTQLSEKVLRKLFKFVLNFAQKNEASSPNFDASALLRKRCWVEHQSSCRYFAWRFTIH